MVVSGTTALDRHVWVDPSYGCFRGVALVFARYALVGGRVTSDRRPGTARTFTTTIARLQTPLNMALLRSRRRKAMKQQEAEQQDVHASTKRVARLQRKAKSKAISAKDPEFRDIPVQLRPLFQEYQRCSKARVRYFAVLRALHSNEEDDGVVQLPVSAANIDSISTSRSRYTPALSCADGRGGGVAG